MLRRVLSDKEMGMRFPWYLGRAYRDYELRVTILYPIPLNWIVGWSRNLLYYLRLGPSARWEKSIRDTAYQEGLEWGLECGRQLIALEIKYKIGNEGKRMTDSSWGR